MLLKTTYALCLTGWAARAAAEYSLSITGTSPFSLAVESSNQIVVNNSAILAGPSNTSVVSVSASRSGSLSNGSGSVSTARVSPQVFKVQVNTSSAFVGARFAAAAHQSFYGVWEYPWNEQVDNRNVSFPLLGLGDSEGVNWANARAPFFLTTAGYGVYADSAAMSYWDFTVPGEAQFVFNGSSLVYYILLPKSASDYKSIIEAYTALSARIEMPPDSGYGPTFWSDDFEEDFHGSVSNAQENYYDVVDHLYHNQIHASSMFADRPYGTGNSSWGNFDFDPLYYPTPAEFIANLSDWGYDFQVWGADRAFLYTELFNASRENGWLFPGIDPVEFLGPALNLSIPAAYDWFLQKLECFTSVGVKGYKIDRGEEGEMPDYEQNVQNLLIDQLFYQNMEKKWGKSGFYNFARSAYDRSRAKTAIWNGDSHSNYSGLAYSVRSGIRAGLLGFSQWGSDTGGYIRNANDPQQDLWERWMQYSAFCPVYEVMIGTNHTPWYPTPANPYTPQLVDVLRQTANLHHDLLPYIRSFTYAASTTGVPLIRALFLEAPHDAESYTVDDAYFFGSEFLVAPIVTPDGRRSVYFPRGTDYLEYFNKTQLHRGGTTANVSLSTKYIPAFVRAGAIVPRGDIFQANNKWTQKWQPSLTIELYPSFQVPESTFEYYDGASGKPVELRVRTDADSACVSISYGQLGLDGALVVFTKDGQRKARLHAGGGSVKIERVRSLFTSG